MSELGVNEHHQNQVINYMRFARYQRGQRLRAVDACFEELQGSRLNDATFTRDEMIDMLDGLLSVVRGEVESELINTAHTNVLMMRQMFQQSEKWHLKLQADISELENRDLLEQIKEFEEREFTGTKRDTEFTPSKLAPLNETGGSALLHMRIDEIMKDNDALRQRLSKYEKVDLEGRFRSQALATDLEKAEAELRARKSNVTQADLEDLHRKMSGLQSDLEQSRRSGADTAANLTQDLAGTKHELLKIREMLEMAEKELEKKVSLTTPFKNLKQMLQKKNDQMKDLRKRLSKYETVDD
ncbi:hypothetical protein SNE40_010291 [Patella caerulea]|uniref:Leucine zipper transcription factor-like protein 1 n=1 Tax=Patella caerulea TaxID=87958 RepID=A0AAN8K0Q1_PATCE